MNRFTVLTRGMVFFCLGAALLFLGVSSAQAGPAAPHEQTLSQPGGSTFSARAWGDEFQNGYETLDGYTILQDEFSKAWVYARRTADGKLASSLKVVGKDSPRGLEKHTRPAPADRSPLAVPPLDGDHPASGEHPLLVLLVEFNDTAHTYTPAQVSPLLDSIHDFYDQASYGSLDMQRAAETSASGGGAANDGIVGWLPAGINHPGTGWDAGIAIANAALSAADPYVNFAAYDDDDDGVLMPEELHVLIMAAGYEKSYTCDTCNPGVWAHWTSWSSPVVDGKQVRAHSMVGERHISHLATVGPLTHELGHDLWMPDLYDTSQATEGVGRWSIMGSGSWNSAPGGYYGSSPALPDAFLRWYKGWLTPTYVGGTLAAEPVSAAHSAPDAYLLGSNPDGLDWEWWYNSGEGEYFLVENRQQGGFDAGLPGCGLLVWHIDESETPDNSTNNGTQPLVYLVQADGSNHLMTNANRGDAGDPYPGSSGNTTFNDSSTPNSKLYSGAASGASVTNISAGCADVKTADLSYGMRSLAVSVSGSGTVTSDPAGINAPSVGEAVFADGASVTLTAHPAAGYKFQSWGGACSGTALTCSLGMDANKSASAAFIPIPWYSLTVGVTGSGTVTSSPTGINAPSVGEAEFQEGVSVTLTAQPGAGYKFQSWSGDCSGTSLTCSLGMDGEKIAGAVFVPIPWYKLTLSVTGSGTVTSDPAGINAPSVNAAEFQEGTSVTLSADPGPRRLFLGWSGDCSGSNPQCTLQMNAPHSAAAEFIAAPFERYFPSVTRLR